MKLLIFLAALVSGGQASEGGEPGCIERHIATRLDTLEIRTCLYGYAATDQVPARAFEIRQTLTNVSAKPIELLLSEDPMRRHRPIIRSNGDSRRMNKMMQIPSSEDDDFAVPVNEHVRLKPRASTELSYRLVDMMIEPPSNTETYHIVARTNFDFRRDGEKLDDIGAIRARVEEENAIGRGVEFTNFSDVGISSD